MTEGSLAVGILRFGEYGFTVGFMIGAFSAARPAIIQFMAETQHEMPLKTRAEQIVYARNRNYHVLGAAGSAGMKRGIQLGLICAGYAMLRWCIDDAKAHLQILRKREFEVLEDAAIISLGMAGLLGMAATKTSRWYYWKRGAKLGLVFGGALGILRQIRNININENKI